MRVELLEQARKDDQNTSRLLSVSCLRFHCQRFDPNSTPSAVHFAHADYTKQSFGEVLRVAVRRGDVPNSVLTAYEGGQRVAICNVWRANIARPPEAKKLGLRDGVVFSLATENKSFTKGHESRILSRPTFE